MKKIFFIVFLVAVSFNLSSQPGVDIFKPMYGEVEKSEALKKAEEEFRKAEIEKFGSVDSAMFFYLNKAWSYLYNNDPGTAMKRFNMAWLFNPEYPDAYFGFAALLDLLGNYDEARRFYLLGAEKDTDNQRTIICFHQIAECREHLEDITGAVDALLKIRMLQPDDPYLFKRLGYLYMKNGDNLAALEAYTRAIELDPEDPDTYHNRAYLYQEMKDVQRAIVDYTQCVLRDPTNTSAFVNRGILEMQRDNYDAGKQDFETGSRINGQSGEIRRLLGVAKLSLDDKKGACEDFTLAKELGDTVVDDLIDRYCK